MQIEPHCPIAVESRAIHRCCDQTIVGKRGGLSPYYIAPLQPGTTELEKHMKRHIGGTWRHPQVWPIIYTHSTLSGTHSHWLRLTVREAHTHKFPSYQAETQSRLGKHTMLLLLQVRYFCCLHIKFQAGRTSSSAVTHEHMETTGSIGSTSPTPA